MPKPRLVDYLIIGGGIAGVTAAEEIRSRDTLGRIVIVSQEAESLYSPVVLSKYVSRKIEREKVFLRTINHYLEKGIEVLAGVSLTGVNFETREAILTVNERLTFRKLLIATGGMPAPWPVKGSDNANIFRFKTLRDADELRDALFRFSRAGQARALVVGGGLIGLEFVGLAARYGSEVTWLIKERECFGGAVGEEGWNMMLNNFRRNGVDVRTETEIIFVESAEDGLTAIISGGDKIKGTWVGLDIGLESSVFPFQGTGIDVGKGIKVNSFLECSIKDVWAAGDAAEYYDDILDEYTVNINWSNAFLQGKIAGINMTAGNRVDMIPFHFVSSRSIINLGFHYTLVGRTIQDAGVETVQRIWPRENAYQRFFFRDGRLRGAILINSFRDKAAAATLIENKSDLSGVKSRFSDNEFDIKKLL